MLNLRAAVVEVEGLVSLLRSGEARRALRIALLSNPHYNVRKSMTRRAPKDGVIPTVSLRALLPVPHDVTVAEFSYYDNSAPLIDLCALISLAQARSPRRILEIGTSRGMTALNFALALPNAVVTTVDIADRHTNLDETVSLPWGTKAHVSSTLHIGELLKLHPEVGARVTRVVADSTQWEPDGQFDFIFIDGAHDYASVEADTRIAFSALSRTGMVVWHDYEYSAGARDVPRFLEDLSSRVLLRHLTATRLVIYEQENTTEVPLR